MLEQIDKLDGVQASLANHAGTMIRVSLRVDADSARVSDSVQQVLSESGKPTQLRGTRATQPMKDETWRDIGRIGELSAIEFRTLLVERLTGFAKEQNWNPETTAKLVQIVNDEWNRLLSEIDVTVPPHRAAWHGHCQKIAGAFLAKARLLLTADQLEKLKAAAASQFDK